MCSPMFIELPNASEPVKNMRNHEKRERNKWKWAKNLINLPFWRVGRVSPPPPVFSSVPQASKYVRTHEKSLKLRKISNKCLKSRNIIPVRGQSRCTQYGTRVKGKLKVWEKESPENQVDNKLGINPVPQRYIYIMNCGYVEIRKISTEVPVTSSIIGGDTFGTLGHTIEW